MIIKALYRLLDWPWIYRLSQRVLVAGADKSLGDKIRRLVEQSPRAGRILEVGCGPQSYLWLVGLRPIGLDLSPAYTAAFARGGDPAVTASGTRIPFADASFDSVWTIGVLHHLPDAAASRAVREMVRVCRPGGRVFVLDAVLPEPWWRRPFAYAVRRADRGGHVRRQDEFPRILPADRPYTVERFTFSHTGLECLIVVIDNGAATAPPETGERRVPARADPEQVAEGAGGPSSP